MFGNNARDLIATYLDWHSATINPKEQSLPPSLFESLSSESLKLRKFPGFQIILLYAAYTDDQKRCSIRPKADVCYFINAKVVENLAKNPDVVATLHNLAMDTFGPLMGKLRENMAEVDARKCAIRYVVALVRAAMGKSTKELGLPMGKKVGAMAWGEEKIMAIKKCWAFGVELEHPDAKGLALALGFKGDVDPGKGDDEDEDFDLPGKLESEPSCSVVVGLSFGVGDLVETTNRFTLKISIPGDANFRRDIPEGSLARVVSWAADDHSKANIGMDLEV